MKVYKNTHNNFSFTRRNNKNEVITTTPQEIIFSVKENFDDENYLIQKKMTEGDISMNPTTGEWTIRLIPNDTARLAFGRYYCDVKIINEYGLSSIIVAPQVFEILETVTIGG